MYNNAMSIEAYNLVIQYNSIQNDWKTYLFDVTANTADRSYREC